MKSAFLLLMHNSEPSVYNILFQLKISAGDFAFSLVQMYLVEPFVGVTHHIVIK